MNMSDSDSDNPPPVVRRTAPKTAVKPPAKKKKAPVRNPDGARPKSSRPKSSVGMTPLPPRDPVASRLQDGDIQKIQTAILLEI